MRVLILIVLAVCFVSARIASPTCAKLCFVRAVTKDKSPSACYAKCVADVKKASELMDNYFEEASVESAEEAQSDAENTLKSGASLRTTQSVNVRDGACTDKRILTTLSPGSVVTFNGGILTACQYTWLQVKGSFGTGWLARNFVEEVPAGSGSTGSGSGSFTADTLKRVFPLLSASKADEYFPFLKQAMDQGNINTCLRRTAFLAQLGHESGQLRWFEEFASGDAYEGRRDLGNTQPGDGRRYKGRGPIQLTGRANYRSAGAALGLPLEQNPTMAATKEVGFRIAVWFWNTRSLSSLADQGTQSAFDQITRRINGGFNGKADRDHLWASFRRQLGC